MRPRKFPPAHSSAALYRSRRDSVLCGINAVREAIRVDTRRIETIWVAEPKDGKRLRQVVALAAERDTPVETVPASLLTEVAGTTTHQGIVAFMASSPLVSFEQFTRRLTAQQSIPPIVILDGVKDPHNLGAIIRAAAVFGIGGVIVPGRRAAGVTATVAKTAAGGLEHVAVSEVTNIAQTLERLKRAGFWIVGADETAEISCRTFAFPTPLALILGAEESGISSLVKRHCDALVSIPARGSFCSLNVAVAAAILFYEAVGRELRGPVAAANPHLDTSAL